ncbi:MAG: phenylalanine--tRNA ligase subunit beta [Elusimicrobia bacterium]|nr:phenylalanine--tRNA ligase subunit beta [Elusimicrobiota bacterium]
MRISRAWLNEFLAEPLPVPELLRLLPALGFDVDAVETLGPAFEGVVVGEVIEARKHPNADRLSLCKVTDGKESFGVVCGAPNVAAGQRVAFARVGAKLAGGLTISKANIRGEESQGMICSTAELGLGAESAGILVLCADAPLGSDAASLLAESDESLEVDVTANRPDCLSVRGLARELSILLGRPLNDLPSPSAAEDHGVPARPVEIEDPALCRRYIGREFRGLKVGPSPGWLARRLEAVGQKPINALVDISNYVLFELGHPLHVFDSDKLKGGIRVRRAKAGESIKALDGKIYALSPADIVIADETGPVAIAGVMGGEQTGVTEKTVSCFLESAHFDPRSIRATSRRLGLRSDASYRFERGADVEAAELAGRRASQLILKLCRAKAGPAVDAYPGRSARALIEVAPAALNAILGTSFPREAMARTLLAMDEKLEERGQGWLFHPPSWRQDLSIKQDLAEEVARYAGYDSIPDEPGPARPSALREPASVKAASLLRRRLEGLGFYEIFSADLVAEKALLWDEGLFDGAPVEVENPLAEDQARLRTSLFPGLLQSALYNLDRGAGNLRFFELGRAYRLCEDGKRVEERSLCAGILAGEHPPRPHWKVKPSPADFYDAKGVLESLLDAFGLEARLKPCAGGSAFHPKACVGLDMGGRRIALAGRLDPRLLSAFDLAGRPVCAFVLDVSALASKAGRSQRPIEALSSFPSMVRDLSMTFPEEAAHSRIVEVIEGLPLEALANIELADLFTGKGIEEGRKSCTLRFTFSLPERTLVDEEVNGAMEKIVAALQSRSLMGRLRGA